MEISNPNRSEKDCVSELLQLTGDVLRTGIKSFRGGALTAIEWDFKIAPLLDTDLWHQTWWDALQIRCRLSGPSGPSRVGERFVVRVEGVKSRADIHVSWLKSEEPLADGTCWAVFACWRPWFVLMPGAGGSNPLVLDG